MSVQDTLAELETLGKASYKRVLMRNHGVREPCFGVSIAELKKIQKRIGKDHRLALDLYATGNYDAMYLAGLIADDRKMTREDLQLWAAQAYAGSLAGTTVAGTAAESLHGREMALRWIESPESRIAEAGWATLSSLVSIKPDEELDLVELERLLDRVGMTLPQAPDAVRYQMNAFVICTGCYVKALTERAIMTGEILGPVAADLGDNDCGIPFSPDCIRKVQTLGKVGKKRKRAKC